jgi:hypothetical protein
MTVSIAVLDRNDDLHEMLTELSKALSDGHKHIYEGYFSVFAQAYRAGVINPKQNEKSEFPSLISLQLTAITAYQSGRNGGERRPMDYLTNRLDEMVALTALEIAPGLQVVAKAFTQESHELDMVLSCLIKQRDSEAADMRKQTTRSFQGIFGDFASRRANTFAKEFFKNLTSSDIVDAIAQAALRYRNAAAHGNPEEVTRFQASAEKLVILARGMGGSHKQETMKLLSEVQNSLESKNERQVSL